MKKYFLLLMTLAIVSCTTSQFRQVYTVESPDVSFQTDGYAFSNEDVRVSYYFWENYGKMTFTINNLGTKPIFVDLNRCHFISNGYSNDYFENSSNSAISMAYTKTVHSKQFIEIPPKSHVKISKFELIEGRYMDCKLKYKDFDQPIHVGFNQENSPAKFRNYITYDFSEKFENPRVVDNSFWIKDVVFMEEDEFFGKQYLVKECSQDDEIFGNSRYTLPYCSANTFFIQVLR